MPPIRRLKRALPHHEKINLLDMLEGGKSCADVARHYDLNESTVRYIKKKETEIRMAHNELLKMTGLGNCKTIDQNVADGGQPTWNFSERRLRSFKSRKCTNANLQPQVSTGRPKRKTQSNLACVSSATSDGDEAEAEVEVVVEDDEGEYKEDVEDDEENDVDDEGHIVKKRRKVEGKDSVLQTKECIAEEAEHMYDTHICPECRRCFKMRSHLQEHLHLHYPDPGLQCPTCERFFTSRSKLRVHQLREAGEKAHHCHLCDYSAVEPNAIRRHLVTVHADEMEEDATRHRYPCPTCGQSFGQSGTLKAHMKTEHARAPKTAVACFHDGCPFRSHLRRAHMRHSAEEHGITAVGCPHHACVAVFPSENHMETHFKTHLAYHCSQCDFSCSNKAAFLRHQRQGHAGSEKLCCNFCDFSTFNPVQFKRHIGHLHANEKIHRCSHCSYVTSHKRALNRHMMTHSGEKPHKCQLCDFRCRDESYLSKHMLTHSDDRNFICEECGYVTKWRHCLNIHMRKHAGDLSPKMSPKLSAPLVYFGPKLKRKRKVMPLYEKVKILNLLRDGKTFSAVARCYGLNESTIRSIKKEEANIRNTVAINGSQTLKRVVNTRNKYIVRMESALVRWITECREKNIPLNTNAMMEKARQLYQELAEGSVHRGKEDNPQPGPSTSSEEPIEFLASKGWFDRFRKRYQLKSVSPHWESASADVEAARKYPETFKALIEEKGYKPEQVFNMNETGLFWKKIPTRMLMKEEPRAPEFKGQNDRVVLIMCCNAAGFLMKPALIYKSANPRSLKSKDKNLLPVFWMYNSKVSLTKPLVAEWFHESFLPQAKSYLSEKGLDFNICLMMDNASSLPLNLSYEGVRIEILPANIQPLDQGLIWTFKVLYARNVMQQLVNARDTEENVSVGELWKNFNIATALQVIQICLQELKTETVSVCWKKLWPECVPEVEGSSTDEVQRLAVDKAVKLAELVGGEGFRNMTPDDLNDLLETHSNPMADDDSAYLPKQAGEEAEQEDDPSQEEDEVEGLSLERLSVMVKTAKELQGMVDEWDPNMVRALQFKNAIDSAMQTYRSLLTTMKKQREKLTITQDKPTSASSEEAPDYQELLALLPSEAPEEEASYEEL